MANVTRNDRQVSAVIAAYDAAQVLPRAIQSALAQTARPLEVLVVDDGSTDDTGAVAGRFGPPVRCIQQANLGASGARNRALEEVRSEFVAFLDADDEWHPQHLESALALFGRHPELAWTCAAYHRGVRGSQLEACRPREELLVDGSYFPSYFEIASGWTLSMNSLVVRRSVFDEVASPFNNGIEISATITSGLSFSAADNRARPSPTAPTNSNSVSKRRLKPSITMV